MARPTTSGAPSGYALVGRVTGFRVQGGAYGRLRARGAPGGASGVQSGPYGPSAVVAEPLVCHRVEVGGGGCPECGACCACWPHAGAGLDEEALHGRQGEVVLFGEDGGRDGGAGLVLAAEAGGDLGAASVVSQVWAALRWLVGLHTADGGTAGRGDAVLLVVEQPGVLETGRAATADRAPRCVLCPGRSFNYRVFAGRTLCGTESDAAGSSRSGSRTPRKSPGKHPGGPL